MFNHVYDICSKVVFMENANFMIFKFMDFPILYFLFYVSMAKFLEHETIFNNLCIVGLQYYIN